MARWRAAAIERIPNLRELIAGSENIFDLWIRLGSKFERAYSREPVDDSLISQIYSFADWCVAAPRGPSGHDPLSAAVVGFYEDVPNFPAARRDMPRWFTYAEVAENRAVFSYMIGDAEYEDLVKHMAAHRHLYLRRSRPPQFDDAR